MYPEKKGGSHKMARPPQNWGLLTLLIRWASTWTMPNTASPKSEPPCGRAVYTPVRATILGHPPQKTAPPGGGGGGKQTNQADYWIKMRIKKYASHAKQYFQNVKIILSNYTSGNAPNASHLQDSWKIAS